MKMNEVKSVTWTKLAEIKTNARTPKGIYRVLCKEFDVDFFENVFAVVSGLVCVSSYIMKNQSFLCYLLFERY